MTAPATPPDWDSIARFLSGESSAEEAAVVRAWLDANPGDRELLHRLNETAVIDADTDVDVEMALARVHQRMQEAPRLTLERGPARSLRSRFVWLGGIAAAAAATIVLYATANRSTSPTPIVAEARTYTTGIGRRDSVRLADGSLVVLGPRSRLEVSRGFGGDDRAVALSGDAYFEVRHDAAKPFRVRANGALIEDLGTAFTIESDAGEGTSVSVVAGSVRLGRDSLGGERVVLAAGDRGSIDAAGATHVEHNAVRSEDTTWVSGRLAFRDAPLSRVAAEVERWYGVKMLVTDSGLRAQHVTTSFEGESADQALRILGLTMGAKIERRGDSAIVSLGHGPTTSR